MPAKAIPPNRDRLQSRLLVAISVPFLSGSSAFVLWLILRSSPPHHPFLIKSLAISCAFALTVWLLRAATLGAGVCGGMICLTITAWTGYTTDAGGSPWHSGLIPLLTLFIMTFVSTRLGQRRKVAAGLAECRKGRRASQVVANLGFAAFLACPLAGIVFDAVWEAHGFGRFEDRFVAILVLAALAEATADTVSSEIGQAFGGTPFMLTTLRRVPPGTDGAFSLTGTLAGIAAAAIIAATGAPALGMSLAERLVAFAAGVAGLFFDSLLGATVERKGWIGNDLVNFISTAFAAALSLLAISFAQPWLLR